MVFTLYPSRRRIRRSRLRSSESSSRRNASVDPVRGRFKLNELLTGLGVAPHPHHALVEPTLLRRAIPLDQLLDAGAPFRADPIDFHDGSAYLRRSVHTVLD